MIVVFFLLDFLAFCVLQINGDFFVVIFLSLLLPCKNIFHFIVFCFCGAFYQHNISAKKYAENIHPIFKIFKLFSDHYFILVRNKARNRDEE